MLPERADINDDYMLTLPPLPALRRQLAPTKSNQLNHLLTLIMLTLSHARQLVHTNLLTPTYSQTWVAQPNQPTQINSPTPRFSCKT